MQDSYPGEDRAWSGVSGSEENSMFNRHQSETVFVGAPEGVSVDSHMETARGAVGSPEG